MTISTSDRKRSIYCAAIPEAAQLPQKSTAYMPDLFSHKWYGLECIADDGRVCDRVGQVCCQRFSCEEPDEPEKGNLGAGTRC